MHLHTSIPFVSAFLLMTAPIFNRRKGVIFEEVNSELEQVASSGHRRRTPKNCRAARQRLGWRWLKTPDPNRHTTADYGSPPPTNIEALTTSRSTG